MAQTLLVILLAKAIATSMRGFRASMRDSHEPGLPPSRPRQCTMDIDPAINKRRISGCPIFEVRPSFCFPPLECCRGTSPSKAEKSSAMAHAR
jgi:hypothetical protein